MAERPAHDAYRSRLQSIPREGVAAGSRLGRMQLLTAIGTGNAARVWAARRDDGALVAVKTFLPHLAENRDVQRAFDDVMGVILAVCHPNLCAVLELGAEEDVLFVASEWVEGESLHHVLGADEVPRPLDTAVAARIVADACAGIHAAHEATSRTGRTTSPPPLLHRDLTGRNLLVGVDGRTRVSDFGIAVALAPAGPAAGKGTPVAPEALDGRPLDVRADVFSLGCVLYEITTGTAPLDGVRDAATFRERIRRGWTAPGRIVPGYSPDLEAVVLRAMAVRPEDRYPTSSALGEELENWLTKRAPRAVDFTEVAALVRARVGSRIDSRRARIRAVSQELTHGTDQVGSPTSGLRPVPPEIDLLNPPIPGPALVPVVRMPKAKPSGHPPAKETAGREKRRFLTGALVGFLLFAILAVLCLSVGGEPEPSPAAAEPPAAPEIGR